MSNSMLKQAMKHTRATLRTREQAALENLQSAWAACKAAIQALLNKFLALMRRSREAKGETLPFFWLFEENRLEVLKQQLTEVITRYVSSVDTLTDQVATDATTLAADAARAQLAALSIPPAASGPPGPPGPRGGSFGWIVDKIITGIAGVMILAVSDLHPTVEASLNNLIDELSWQAETRLITTLHNGYRNVQIAALATKDLGWIWRTEEDRRVCTYCKGMDGSRHPPGEEMKTHARCRCEAEPVQS